VESGRVVGDRFVIEREAGAGGMGVVYRAHDRARAVPVALKIGEPRSRARYEREAKLLREVEHPGIVGYVAHGVLGAAPWLAMEWLEGEGLERRLARGPLASEEAVTVVAKAAEALGVAHARGIVHHDVKPSNVWLVDGDLARVKLLDFGLAEGGAFDAEARGGAGEIRGTPAYMAPEQVRGAAIDPRTDVYALACVLFECLAGRPPFGGDHAVAILVKTLLEEPPRLRELLADVPRALDALLVRALAKEASARPADGAAFAREVAEAWARRAAPPSLVPASLPTSIGGGEQRVASIVLFGATRGDDATVETAGWSSAVDAAREVVASFDARLEVMVGGSVAVLLESRGDASDQARRAASCALALARATGGATMALATGRTRSDGATGARAPIGEVVDRAVALLADAQPGIRIDDVTASLLGEGFATEGGVLLGRREGDRTLTLLGKPTPTLGREREIAALEAAFTETLTDGARAVVVTGPAGIGKTRLRRELLQRLRERETPATVWIARGDPASAGAAFGLAAQIVRRAARVLEGEPLEVRQAKLAARVAAALPAEEAPRVTRFLAEMIGAPFRDEDDVVLATARRDAMVMFDQIRTAWERWVAAATATQPLLVVLDDLQWGDRPTISLVDSALRVLERAPLLVVAFARPEVSATFPDLFAERRSEVIEVGPLPRAAAEELVTTTLGKRADEATVRRIVERAAGNAFFLEEIVRATAEHREGTPETALLMVQSRLDALAAPARRVLRAASVFGRSFHEGGVAALVGDAVLDGRAIADWLTEMEQLEIVARRAESKFAGERELAFHHAIVQEAAYSMLTESDRVLGHGLAAAWLERAGETDAVTLARHWEHAGEAERSIATWLRAAEQSLDGNDYAEAIARAERGLALGATDSARGHLHLVVAAASKWLGDNARSVLRARAAMEDLDPRTDAWAEAAADHAMALHRLLRRHELAEIAELLRERLLAPTDALVNASARVAHYLLITGQRDVAERIVAAIEAATPHVSLRPATRGRLEQVNASRAIRDGRPAEYAERLVRAAELAAAAGDLRQACSANANRGYGLLELGVVDEAEQVLRRVLVDSERLGLRHVAANARQNLGWALYRLKRWAEASAMEEQCAAVFAAQGDRRMEGASWTYLAAIRLAAGALEAAEDAARRGLACVDDAPPARPPALAVLARVTLRRGRIAEARTLAEQAMHEMEQHGAEEGEALVRLVLAEALEASGERAAATQVIAAAAAQLAQVAARIHRADWRHTYYEAIEEHAATRALARAWGVPVADEG
jgi:tetratricopeptide (TPR) repeat protein